MNLTVPFEVLKYSPAGMDYPSDNFCILIPQLELQMKRECLGKDLFDFLVDHLNTYPTNPIEWDSSVSYSIGDIVVRNGCTFTSTANANTTDPLDSGSDWDEFERFNHTGANELWSGFLRQIMAYKVYIASLNPATYRSGAGGLVINTGDSSGFRSATKTEMLTTISQHTAFVQLMTENMIEWLNCNYSDLGLPSLICIGNCDIKKNRSRRFAFR